MEFEFDKEIDFLLRQTARSEVVSAIDNPNSAHLDADAIAAFAENALPEKARLHYVAHLADCSRCRKNLANLIALDSAAQSEIIHAKETQFLTNVAPEIPWYRKLFAVPNLVYALGALVLLFSGIGVYTVLQSNSKDSQVSGVYEKQIGGRGMSSDGDASVSETFSNSNSSIGSMSNTSAAMNTAANTSSGNSASASNSANSAMPLTVANSNAVTMSREADKDLKTAAKPAETRSEPSDLAKSQDSVAPTAAAPLPAPVKEDQSENELQKQQPNTAQQNVVTQNQTQMMPDSRNAQRAPSGALLSENKKTRKLEEARDDASGKSTEATNVGGKTFRRENGVWYDATYRGQATTNISRGTKEYKNLDKDLRQIVERVGGTVVVVWKEKAYRIQ